MKNVIALFTIIAGAIALADAHSQLELEGILHYDAYDVDDDLGDMSNVKDDSLVCQDPLQDYGHIVTEWGWTTNELIDAFIAAYSNNIDLAIGGSYSNEVVARMAIGSIALMRHQKAKEFAYYTITNDERVTRIFGVVLPAAYLHSNYEPEVFDFMRTICVQTNKYEGIATYISFNLYETLPYLPTNHTASATTNLAKYSYFVLKTASRKIYYHDDELAQLIPEYSNSVQRLAAMRYVAATATNNFERANASNIVERLSAMPTNELNNIEWITQ